MIEIRLKQILEEKNMSIARLHELTGVSQNTLGLIANGKNKGIQFETLDKILNALNLELKDILRYYNNKNYIYTMGIDNDYSPLKELEKRFFRFDFMNLTEEGEKQHLFDLTFSVHYFQTDFEGSLTKKFNLYISFHKRDFSRICENEYLAEKLNYIFSDRSGLSLMGYLITDDILRNLELNAGCMLSIVDWTGFERDNVYNFNIQVPITTGLKEKRNSFNLTAPGKINLAAFNMLSDEFSNITDVLYFDGIPHIEVMY